MMLTLQYMISGILCDALLLYGTENSIAGFFPVTSEKKL